MMNDESASAIFPLQVKTRFPSVPLLEGGSVVRLRWRGDCRSRQLAPSDVMKEEPQRVESPVDALGFAVRAYAPRPTREKLVREPTA